MEQMMIIEQEKNKEKTLGHIVSGDYRKSRALNKLGIDYSCGGNRTLGQVFMDKGHELDEVLQEWEQLGHETPQKGMDFLGWDIAFLTKYIIQLHHQFVYTQTRFVTELAFKVADSNEEHYPGIRAVASLFEVTGRKLEEKGLREEKVIFPYIIDLHEASVKGTRMRPAEFGRLGEPVAAIKTEGEQLVAALRQIRGMTNNYIAPAYSSSTCPILYKLLAGYEEDALLHLHLENNILFPRAVETENCLRATQQLISS